MCWNPYREGQVSALNRVQKRAAKFANNFQGIQRETGLESGRNILPELCYLSRGYDNRKIRNRKLRTSETMLSE